MPKRAERSRFRVGWYGQRNLHVADLNVIEQVVARLACDVDFVFYGDLPEGLRSRAAEFESYPATAMELFPAVLAMLDLDILLSPLAKNEFNECKSNLRLLQAGMIERCRSPSSRTHRAPGSTRFKNASERSTPFGPKVSSCTAK